MDKSSELSELIPIGHYMFSDKKICIIVAISVVQTLCVYMCMLM